MPDPIEILWQPAGFELDALSPSRLVDVSDGDTPNIRMPVRMLSVDTPEVTAKSEAGAARVDARFLELAEWIRSGHAPIGPAFRDHILPKLETGTAGSLQFVQGQAASAYLEARIDERIARPGKDPRSLFLRAADERFDRNGRLLAYVAPSYTATERRAMSRRERSTFNLDLMESGHAMPFILFPSIPGELDLPLAVEVSVEAMEAQRGQYADEMFLPAYEYRAAEKLYRITRDIVAGDSLSATRRLSWRSRYCADMRDRRVHGPETYMGVPIPYRLWIWPADLQTAIAKLNLVPAPNLVA